MHSSCLKTRKKKMRGKKNEEMGEWESEEKGRQERRRERGNKGRMEK